MSKLTDDDLCAFPFYSEPYIIAFVETMYTVVEGEGPVEVCVNLTDPTFDILDDTISVNILNDESSIYIPSVGILASEALK